MKKRIRLRVVLLAVIVLVCGIAGTQAALANVALDRYLQNRPRIRAQMGFETDRPLGSQDGVWLYYDYWPREWKDRLLTLYIAFCQGSALPLVDPFPLANADIMADSSRLAYRSVEVARDVYFAQVAHTLWLDSSRRVPWRLEDWSDHELSYLLSSKVCFSARRLFPDYDLYYVTHLGSRNDATENILQDPRIPFRFMAQEPERGKCLIGATPSETAQNLSGWFHDYLWHFPGDFDSHSFHRNNPRLADRLRRHSVRNCGNVYLASAGCWSASALFVDLMRSVNVPVRKIHNIILSFSGEEEGHSGLAFNWQGGSDKGRYLLHTDDLYCSSYFKDPAPAPKGTGRGVPLWNHVWLDPSAFGQAFAYDASEDIFAKATSEQKVKYWEIGDWLVSSAQAIRVARASGQDGVITLLQSQRNLSKADAEACWQAVEASVLAYGDGDMELGYQCLLDGPNSRHSQWCRRTAKCSL